MILYSTYFKNWTLLYLTFGFPEGGT